MKKALIIDDDASNLEVLGMIVESMEWQVISSLKGEDLVKLALLHQPDLIILDIILPDGDGREFCAKLRAENGLSEIPIYLISTNKPPSDDGLTKLANGFIEKPFDLEAITCILHRFGGGMKGI